jgi:hypothetical protein
VLTAEQHFQGDKPGQLGLPGPVDHAHAAAAEFADDVVARDLRQAFGIDALQRVCVSGGPAGKTEGLGPGLRIKGQAQQAR